MAFLSGGGSSAQTPPPPPMAPPPFQATKPAKKPQQQPTFLGAEKTPGAETQSVGMERGKTLLGQ